MKKVSIIGAGLSGLASALLLKRRFGSNIHIDIIEKGNVGSNNQTQTKIYRTANGLFLGDIGGHFFHYKNYSKIFELLPELENVIRLHRKTAFVDINNQEIPAPIQQNYKMLNDEALVRKITNELNNLPEEDLTNIQTMLKTRYGETLYKEFFTKYNKKMYNTNDLSSIPVSFQEQTINTELKKEMYNADFFYPISGGIHTLNEQLLKELEKEKYVYIHNNLEVVKIMAKRKMIRIRNNSEDKNNLETDYCYDYLINTIPLDLFSERIFGIEHPDIVFRASKGCVINLGVNSNHKNTTTNWIYYPDGESIYRVGSYSTVSENMAPKGKSSIYVETTSLNKHFENNELKNMIDFLIQKGWMSDREIDYIDKIYLPINYPFHDDAVDEYIESLKKYNILNIGRNGSWNWKSMHNSFIDAELACDMIKY